VQSYLAIKYGISKNSVDNVSTGGQDERDYFASDGSVIWDFSANPAHTNGIAGIGRDDNSLLDQQQSTDGEVTINKGAAFTNDLDFIIWGNNGAITTSTDVPVGYDVRSNRVWKVDLTGTPGSVSFAIDLAAAGIQNTGNVADYALLVDADGIFNAGATTHTTGATLVGNLLSFTNLNLADGDFFAIAINNFVFPNAPGNVTTNLRLWLKADAGVTGAAPVSAWADQSTLGNDASVPANGPDLMAGQINFNPAMDFTSANTEYMQITNGILGGSAYTDAWVYYVSKPDAVQTNTIFHENLSGASEYFMSLNIWSNGQTYYDFGSTSGGGRLNGNAGAATGVFNMWTLGSSSGTSTPNGTNKAIYRDGLAILSSNNSDGSVAGNNQNFFIGGRYTGINNYYLDGQIAELIVYTAVPTILEQEKVQSYLAIKYGISKNSVDNVSTGGQDERDYFASDGSVIWDFSANPAHANGIAGIGRDDNSLLDQQQSTDGEVTINKGAAFTNDLDFIIWGNNGAVLTFTTTVNNVGGGTSPRMERVWKVQVSGTPGNVTVMIPNSVVTAPITMITHPSDPSFPADMNRQYFEMTDNGSDYTVSASFSDGDYFTFANATETALPIELQSFEVRLNQQNKVEVTWVTASETNNDFFEVQRSDDGESWMVINNLKGAGNSLEAITYSIIDNTPLSGTSYYRLKQTDFDGQFSYSDLRIMQIEGLLSFSIYPNPASQKLVISSNNAVEFSYIIYNYTGKLVTLNEVDAGSTQHSVDVTGWNKGVYFVRILSNGQSVTEKIIVE